MCICVLCIITCVRAKATCKAVQHLNVSTLTRRTCASSVRAVVSRESVQHALRDMVSGASKLAKRSSLDGHCVANAMQFFVNSRLSSINKPSIGFVLFNTNLTLRRS
jgi:hypothetical protein